MKVTVDKDLCTGCGLCIDTCPEVFELQGDVAIAKAETVPAGQESKVKESAENCPVEAIKTE
ncbi:MAG: ferredoxin [Elusimicrobiota bacterium]